MTHPFESSTARLALEICRYTYAVGVGNSANASDKEDSLAYIKSRPQKDIKKKKLLELLAAA